MKVLLCLGLALHLCAAPAAAESLYREGSYRPLTADNKAYRVGDVLTVQVFENASATTSADTGPIGAARVTRLTNATSRRRSSHTASAAPTCPTSRS